MIVETMTHEEINAEILKDWHSIQNSLVRIGNEYDRERRNMKIDKTAVYSKAYPIRTKAKNNWIIFLSKAPAVNSYKGLNDANSMALVYYQTSMGLRVVKPGTTGGLVLYNSHLFNRYSERINLNTSNLIETIIHFFTNNGYFKTQIIPKEEKEFAVTICKDGLLLGELLHERKWLVQRTFVSRNLARHDQDEIEKELLSQLQIDIEKELNEGEFNKDRFDFYADVAKGIGR